MKPPPPLIAYYLLELNVPFNKAHQCKTDLWESGIGHEKRREMLDKYISRSVFSSLTLSVGNNGTRVTLHFKF